jgi:tetratricopeptide (TPR) repeat protein
VAARRWYGDGVAALRDGTYWRASKLLGEAVKAAPGFAPARARLAEAWLELDDVQRARQQILMAAPAGESLSHLERADRLVVSAIHYAVAAQWKESVGEYRRRAEEAGRLEKAASLFDLGRAHERAAQRAEATAAFEAALREDASLAAAHLRLGRLAARGSDFGKAEGRFAEAERLYQASNNLEGVTEVWYQRAVMEVRRGRLAEAEALLGKAGDLAKATGNLQQAVAVRLQRVTVAMNQGRSQEVERVSAEALALARESGASILVTRAMIDLGATMLARSQYPLAEQHLMDGLNSARANSDARSEARAQANLASLWQLQGRLDEALRYLEPSLTYYQQAGMQVELLQVRAMKARLLRQAGRNEEAHDAFERLRADARTAQSRQSEALAEEGMGTVRWAQERYAESLERFRAAGRIYEETGTALGAGYIQAHLSGLYRKLGLVAEALRSAEAAARTGVERKDQGLWVNGLFAKTLALAEAGKLVEAKQALAAAEKAAVGTEPGEDALEARVAVMALEGGLGLTGYCAAKSGAASSKDAFRLQCALGLRGTAAAAYAAMVLPEAEKQGMSESVWLARAVLAAARPGDAAARREAAAAMERFELTLGTQYLANYRARPVVARLRQAVN